MRLIRSKTTSSAAHGARSAPKKPPPSALCVCCLVLLFYFVGSATPYNRPDCDSWPEQWQWQSLADSLDGDLYGPFFDEAQSQYERNCVFTSQADTELLANGQGICMYKHRCINQYCKQDGEHSLPAYSIRVKSIADIQQALAFASTHNIPVSVKSSGHTYLGQSSIRDSLLLWMRHFPISNNKNNNAIKDYVDSCGTTTKTISVAGGANFQETMELVGPNHHVVTGYCQTVVLGGGWLIGGGMSYTHRKFGYGVDNVVSLEVVLANGTLVTADACQNTDFFWALLGGGPGFGVITNVEYKLLPVTKITTLQFKYKPARSSLQTAFDWIGSLFGLERSLWTMIFGGVDPRDKEAEFTRLWIPFVVDTFPNLEREWGGNFAGLQANFRYAGPIAEARESNFVKLLDGWYEENKDKIHFNFGTFSELLNEYDSWYDYGFTGGPEAKKPRTAKSLSGFTSSEAFSRVIPQQVFDDKPDQLVDILVDLFTSNDITTHANYIMGGAPNDVSATATALHPNMRRGVIEVEPKTVSGAEKLRQFLAGYDTSVCYNHHSALEPNWRDQCWGSNYEQLLEIKNKYDPQRLFNCYHCVGYEGPEFDNDNDDAFAQSENCNVQER